jgi:hypothetical protein
MAPQVRKHPEARTQGGKSLIEASVARRVDERARKHPPSTREIVVDDRYAELLAQDLGCKVTTARTCFWGEPQKRALGVVAWAFKHEPDSPERRAKMVLAWARRRRAGAFRDPEESEREIAQAVAQYWLEHPDKLAETLKAALKNGS